MSNAESYPQRPPKPPLEVAPEIPIKLSSEAVPGLPAVVSNPALLTRTPNDYGATLAQKLDQDSINVIARVLAETTSSIAAASVIIEHVSSVSGIKIEPKFDDYNKDYLTETGSVNNDALSDLWNATEDYDDSTLITIIDAIQSRTHNIPDEYFKTAERVVRIEIAEEIKKQASQ